MAAVEAGIGFVDHENEKGNVSFFLADGSTEVPSDLVDAVKAVQVADAVTDTYVRVVAKADPQPNVPTEGAAQRNIKWLVSAMTSNGFPVNFGIGLANYNLLPAGKKQLDLTTGVGKDLKDAIEANCVSNREETLKVLAIRAANN